MEGCLTVSLRSLGASRCRWSGCIRAVVLTLQSVPGTLEHVLEYRLLDPHLRGLESVGLGRPRSFSVPNMLLGAAEPAGPWNPL